MKSSLKISRGGVLATPALLALVSSAVAASVSERSQSETLVAYFSRSGNTRVVAGQIRRPVGADLLEILSAPANPEVAAHHLSGERLVPFITHGVYGFGNSREMLQQHAPKAMLASGFSMEAEQERRTRSLVTTWLTSDTAHRINCCARLPRERVATRIARISE